MAKSELCCIIKLPLSMKNRSEHEDDDKHELEILKGVAQSWHAHSGSSRSTSCEYDKYRQNFQSKPSRFKLEAMNKSSAKRVERGNWDFKQSLWDSYEIVNVYKRLERGLVLDDSFSGVDAQRRVHRKKRESKKSLTNLFNLISSRRFKEAEDPREDNNHY